MTDDLGEAQAILDVFLDTELEAELEPALTATLYGAAWIAAASPILLSALRAEQQRLLPHLQGLATMNPKCPRCSCELDDPRDECPFCFWHPRRDGECHTCGGECTMPPAALPEGYGYGGGGD